MKTKTLKSIVVIMLLCIANSLVSCESDDQGNITVPLSGIEFNIFSGKWKWISDTTSGTVEYKTDNTYEYEFEDGTKFSGIWEWINENEKIMKTNEFTDFDGTVYTTFNMFEEHEDGLIQYRIQTAGDDIPDASSNWEQDLILTKD